jgi:hypothetical protein
MSEETSYRCSVCGGPVIWYDGPWCTSEGCPEFERIEKELGAVAGKVKPESPTVGDPAE